MATFAYTALTPQGKTNSGSIEADNQASVANKLQLQGLVPMQIEQKKAAPKSKKQAFSLFNSGPRLNTKQQVLITQQLATLIQSGLPVDEALQVITEQTRDKNIIKVLTLIQQYVHDGQPLAASMAKASHSFASAYTASIAAGEKNGQLGLVLQRLADYNKKMQQTKSKIKIAMIYPTIIVLVSVAVVVLLMLFVVPQVAEVITSMNQTLPSLTIALIYISEFMQAWGLVVFLSALFALLVFNFSMRLSGFRYVIHRSVIAVPGLGSLAQTYMAARFCKTMALIYNSGLPIETAIQNASLVVGNDYVHQHIKQAEKKIVEGEDFITAFKNRPILPLIALHLIASGQSNGQLATMLDKAADDMEQKLENTITGTIALLEPLMMLVMGIVVLMIVMAVMVPILDMNQLTI